MNQLKALIFAAMLGLNFSAKADIVYDCINSLVSMQGPVLYVRPGLPIKPAGDPKRQWSQLALTYPCQALRASEAFVALTDGRVSGLQISFMPGDEKVLPYLSPNVQLSVSAQLVRNPETGAMHPLSIFNGDRASFHYAIKKTNNRFFETLRWGVLVYGAVDEK